MFAPHQPHSLRGAPPQVALRAQQLLEVSLLADMRAVVARALSGLDMFSVSDGKLSPTAAVSAAMMTPFTASASAAAAMSAMGQMQGQMQDLKVWGDGAAIMCMFKASAKGCFGCCVQFWVVAEVGCRGGFLMA
jgi:hypothetical protein